METYTQHGVKQIYLNANIQQHAAFPVSNPIKRLYPSVTNRRQERVVSVTSLWHPIRTEVGVDHTLLYS